MLLVRIIEIVLRYLACIRTCIYNNTVSETAWHVNKYNIDHSILHFKNQFQHTLDSEFKISYQKHRDTVVV